MIVAVERLHACGGKEAWTISLSLQLHNTPRKGVPWRSKT